MTDLLIYENLENFCPYCGGRHIDPLLTGNAYDIQTETEWYDCKCDDCGKEFQARSINYLSRIIGDNGCPYTNPADWTCPKHRVHGTVSKPVYFSEGYEGWHSECTCHICQKSYRIYYDYVSGGTEFFDAEGRIIKPRSK